MFFDRYDAGDRLASELLDYKNAQAVVYAIPRGGVLVGYEIAKRLNVPMNVIVSRKVGHPFDREMAVCAIAQDGERVCNDHGTCGLDETWLDYESGVQLQEIKHELAFYSQHVKRHSARGKTAIVVDDGVVTGLTIRAAIHAIKKQHPRQVVLALPVCPHEITEELERHVDEIVVLSSDKHFRGSASAYYTHFPEVFDREVITCLESIQHLYNAEHELLATAL